MAAWAGLGYYARARNLIACARAVARGSWRRFPDSEEGLRALPGIGAYTAAAIAAIAFGRRAVVVDANVERVVARLFAIAAPLPAARVRDPRGLPTAITPAEPRRRFRAGDDGSRRDDLHARATRAACSARCAPTAPAVAAGDARSLSGQDREEAPSRSGAARPSGWVGAGAVLLVRRPDKGMLGGMRALPGGDWGDTAELSPPLTADWRPLGTVAHVFTHFALSLDVMATECPGRPVDGEWWPIDRLDEAGLPTLYARAADLGRAFSEEALAA